MEETELYGLFIIDADDYESSAGAASWAGGWFNIDQLEARIAHEVEKAADSSDGWSNSAADTITFQVVDKDLKILETLDARDLYEEETIVKIKVLTKDIRSGLSALGRKKKK